MKNTIEITEKRRKIQEEYNKEHNITPKSIVKDIREVIGILKDDKKDPKKKDSELSAEELENIVRELKARMLEAAERLDFEAAANFRDEMKKFQNQLDKKKR